MNDMYDSYNGITIQSLKRGRIKAAIELEEEKRAKSLKQFITILEQLDIDPLQHLRVYNLQTVEMCRKFGLNVEESNRYIEPVWFVTVPEDK